MREDIEPIIADEQHEEERIINQWRRPEFECAMFRDYFKYYKSKNPPPSYENVIDVKNANPANVSRVAASCVKLLSASKSTLKPITSWEIFKFPTIPGLIFIRNPFTSAGQRYWMTKSLKDYSRHPYKLNIDAHTLLEDEETWWDVCTSKNARAKSLIPKLRWATLGYHHNWNTKHYSEDFKSSIPQELAEMTGILADAVGYPNFVAEAAIINYYRMNSTLAGHVDHSEDNMEAPLVSVSFGQTGIFLIGGLNAEDPADAVFLRSGDVIIMSGESRLKYHGVPRILTADSAPWNDGYLHKDLDSTIGCDDWEKARDFIVDTRINMNVRQVLKTGEDSLLAKS